MTLSNVIFIFISMRKSMIFSMICCNLQYILFNDEYYRMFKNHRCECCIFSFQKTQIIEMYE